LIPILLLLSLTASAARPAEPAGLTATGHDSRIDVVSEPSDQPGVDGWKTFRASRADGPFEPVNARPQTHTVFSDFLGENGRTFFYLTESSTPTPLPIPAGTPAMVKTSGA
jgi:hypothetical protein